MIDMLGSEAHFIDHLLPIWRGLERHRRGDFVTTNGVLVRQLEAHGIGGLAVHQGMKLDSTVVASYGDVKRARSRKAHQIALLQHGAGQSYRGPRRGRHPSYSGGEDHGDVGLFICPNEVSAARWREAYPAAQVATVGSPRVEHLPQREGSGEPTVAISFHWLCNIVPETRPAFMHFRQAIPALQKEFRVLGHAHPRAWRFVEPWYRRFRVPMVHDFNDVCRQADVYVCDNSSTIYEFAATGRPVVLMNDPGYRRNVEHGLRFWEMATVGQQVDHPSQLPEAVRCALVDPPGLRQERERIVRLVYGDIAGSTERAVQAVMEWAA